MSDMETAPRLSDRGTVIPASVHEGRRAESQQLGFLGLSPPPSPRPPPMLSQGLAILPSVPEDSSP